MKIYYKINKKRGKMEKDNFNYYKLGIVVIFFFGFILLMILLNI